MGGGDGVEDRHHARLQLGFHRGERDRALLAFLFALALALAFCFELGGLVFFAFLGLAIDLASGDLGHSGRSFVEHGAAIGRVEIDDVAQQHLAFVERVAPFDQRGDGQRVLADAADHHLAAGLDALGDRDLTLAREQLDRAHLAQIHAHGIVGAADVVLIDIAARLGLAILGFGLGRLLALLAFDQIDAEFGQHAHRVFDLLRRHLVLRQCGVQLVIGQVAALLAAGHHLLDRDGNRIEERCLGHILAGFSRLRCTCRFARHSAIP